MKNNNWIMGLLIGLAMSFCYLFITFGLSIFLNQVDARICGLIVLFWSSFMGVIPKKK